MERIIFILINAAVKSKYIDLVTISFDSGKIINISKKKNIFIPFKAD